MAKQSEAKAKVTLNSADFEKGAKAVISAANEMSSAVKTAMAATGVAILAVFGAESVKAIFHSAAGVITLGEEMANAGKKAGLAAGQFYLFNNAIEKGLSLKTVAGLIGENGKVLDESANTFRDVAIKLWVVGEKIRGFWLGLMDRVAPVLSQLLDGALGVSLVKAGEDFGNAMVNAGKIIYQMLLDGDLWKNIVTVAVASFAYIGNIISGLVSIAMSDAFAEGFKTFLEYAKTSLEWFNDNFGKLFWSIIIRFESAFLEMWIRIIGKITNLISQFVPVLGDAYARGVDKVARIPGKINDYAQDKLQVDGPKFDNKGSVSEQLKELFKGVKFEIPSIDGKPSQQISDIFAKYLGEFNASNKLNTPGDHFENNTRQKTFGADSLAAIGGGGNVYVGLGILDYNRLQYQELREINRKIGDSKKAPEFKTSEYSKATWDEVTRDQTSSPTN